MFASTWKKKGLNLVFHPLFHDCIFIFWFFFCWIFFIVWSGLQIRIFQDWNCVDIYHYNMIKRLLKKQGQSFAIISFIAFLMNIYNVLEFLFMVEFVAYGLPFMTLVLHSYYCNHLINYWFFFFICILFTYYFK
jgi:hypothetical protein